MLRTLVAGAIFDMQSSNEMNWTSEIIQWHCVCVCVCVCVRVPWQNSGALQQEILQ